MTSRTALPTDPFRSPERALPATTRLDEFEIERVLTQSSFAVVYRAYDHVLKLHVAIKEYLPDALALRSAETQVMLRARSHAERFDLGLQAFIDEAQTLARCDHPALLRIVRILQRHGTVYRVMRYSPGPTLLAHRRELGATPSARSLRSWLDALLGALDALHEEGCVHAAVAPGNILLLPGGRPMLLDFDAVPTALISDRTQSMMAALQPCFEPPEQRAPTGDMAMGPWTDLYALAATLHFCISGQLPTPPLDAAAASPFEPLGAVWTRLCSAQPALGESPPWLIALDECLRPLPAQRPQSVAQLRGMLDAGAPAQAVLRPEPAPVKQRASRESRNKPVRPVPDFTALWSSLPAAAPQPKAQRPPVSTSTSAPTGLPSRPTDGAFAGAPPATGAPARAPAAVAAADAKVIADLDKTFAFIAAQANEEALKPAAATPADPSATPRPAGAKPLTRSQFWMLAAVALVMLLATIATVAWLLKEAEPVQVGGGGMDKLQSLGVPVLAPLEGGTTASEGVSGSAAAEGAGTGSAVGEYPPAGAGPSSRGVAAAPPPNPDLGAAAKASTAATSPREACGERAHFALYQCMQTQCTKPAWDKHAQCVRLRKEQKLG